MEESTNNKNPNSLIAVGAIVVVIIVATILIASRSPLGNNDSNSQSMTDERNTVTNESGDSMMTESSYKDGSYTANGNYTSPAGEEEVEVSVTLEDGVIVATETTPLTENSTSIRYQTLFADNYAERVVGKNIDEVELDVVSGSSLTPKGFSEALEEIKLQAQG